MAIYLACAVIRLAYFNMTGTQAIGDKRYYTGLPVTYAALILPIAFIITDFVPLAKQGLIPVCILGLAFAFIVKFKVPKPKGIFYVIFPVLAIALTVYQLRTLF